MKKTDKGFIKRIARHGPVVGGVVGVLLFLLDFFNVNIDFLSRENRPPEIQEGVRISRNVVSVGETLTAMVIASDPDGGDEIDYFWGSACGRIQLDRFGGPKVTYIAPEQPGVDMITVTVYDKEGKTDRDFVIITIIESRETGSR